MDIVYRAKHNNCHADALSRQPVLSPTSEDDNAEEVQVAQVASQHIDDGGIIDLLSRPPNTNDDFHSFADEQWSDSQLQRIILYLRDGELPDDINLAKKIVADSILYYVGPKSSEIPRAEVSAAGHDGLSQWMPGRAFFRTSPLPDISMQVVVEVYVSRCFGVC